MRTSRSCVFKLTLFQRVYATTGRPSRSSASPGQPRASVAATRGTIRTVCQPEPRRRTATSERSSALWTRATGPFLPILNALTVDPAGTRPTLSARGRNRKDSCERSRPEAPTTSPAGLDHSLNGHLVEVDRDAPAGSSGRVHCVERLVTFPHRLFGLEKDDAESFPVLPIDEHQHSLRIFQPGWRGVLLLSSDELDRLIHLTGIALKRRNLCVHECLLSLEEA